MQGAETMENAIEIRNVTMSFNLEQEKTDTLKEYALKLVKRQLQYSEFQALKQVNLTVKKGESVALVGANGSGKSTLLKVIAGVMSPTVGEVTVDGDIAPLIELGAGFDMDLTARENVYLNGAILGHNRAFMRNCFNDIIDFAELWDFVDVPLKNFSSGMVARLGFSIATQVRAEILLVDEVLAVGDFMFQQKCAQRMDEMLSNGTTLIFVSHDAEQVKRLCNRVIWLKHGKVMDDGPTEKVCEEYRIALEEGR